MLIYLTSAELQLEKRPEVVNQQFWGSLCQAQNLCFRGKDHSLVLPSSVFESALQSLILPEMHPLCRRLSNLTRHVCCSAEGSWGLLSALGQCLMDWVWHRGPGALCAPLCCWHCTPCSKNPVPFQWWFQVPLCWMLCKPALSELSSPNKANRCDGIRVWAHVC